MSDFDLDAIEARAAEALGPDRWEVDRELLIKTIPALVARIRELETQRAQTNELNRNQAISLQLTVGRERDALKAADTFAQDFHTAAADRDRAKATLKDIREYVADLKGDPALTTRRTIADELTKILEYVR